MSVKIHLPKILLFLLFLLLLNIVTVTLGDEPSRITIVNKTEYFLHVFVDATEYLYLESGQSLFHETEPKSQVNVKAFYAPGQGITGSLDVYVEIPYQGSTTECSCQEGQLFGDCTTTPVMGGATTFEINPEDLVSE